MNSKKLVQRSMVFFLVAMLLIIANPGTVEAKSAEDLFWECAGKCGAIALVIGLGSPKVGGLFGGGCVIGCYIGYRNYISKT